jgi:hypothetical protein
LKRSVVAAAILLTSSMPAQAAAVDNGEWAIAKGNGPGIPERPFKVTIDGDPVGPTKLLTFASRAPHTNRFPQVLVIASSGYLRVKSGADPRPPLPFGQSLVLGPAVFGTSTSFPRSTLFFNPQLQRVAVSTNQLHRNGTGKLAIDIVARDTNLPATSTDTNQIMNLRWRILLGEPTAARTQLRLDGTFEFTEQVIPDPVRTAELQSFRLVQVSSMFIDAARHDVDAFRYRSGNGPVQVSYDPTQAGTLLPTTSLPLASTAPTVDSIHADDLGLPNGNTPSYRITVRRATGAVSGPLTPRAFFTSSQDLNDDNLGLWIYRQPLDAIPAGTRGAVGLNLTATASPLTP